ncbi:MAG: hypothetical protein ACR2O4_00690 [Hyphomicrobiaceae bacterium]
MERSGGPKPNGMIRFMQNVRPLTPGMDLRQQYKLSALGTRRDIQNLEASIAGLNEAMDEVEELRNECRLTSFYSGRS